MIMKKILGISLFTLSVCCYILLFGASVHQELSDNILRFHILANSDSIADEQIKLGVRDYVSEKLSGNTLLPSSKEYTKKIEILANDYLAKNSIPYSATAKLERVFIPRKSYKNITMPSGEYNAIRLLLGEGKGENWWCVAYPSLCFCESFEGTLSENANKILKENLSEESYKVITDDVEYRFFIVDLVGKLMEKL